MKEYKNTDRNKVNERVNALVGFIHLYSRSTITSRLQQGKKTQTKGKREKKIIPAGNLSLPASSVPLTETGESRVVCCERGVIVSAD